MWTWPARRFEKAFLLHLLRRARESAREMRDRMVVAFTVSADFEKAEDRQKAIEGVHERYHQTVESLYSAEIGEQRDEVAEEMAADPLFKNVTSVRDQIAFPNAGAGHALLQR